LITRGLVQSEKGSNSKQFPKVNGGSSNRKKEPYALTLRIVVFHKAVTQIKPENGQRRKERKKGTIEFTFY